MRIDERVARCLTMLRGPEFEPLLVYLKAKRLESLEDMAHTLDDKLIYKFQGEAKMLLELIENIEKSETLVAKLKASSRP